jgi:hypothetical protein
MFFNIGHDPLENYPCFWQMGSFCISTDNGWCYTTLGTAEILYKGYADKDTLDRLLEQIVFQDEPKLTGNFCALVVANDTLEIRTDRYRSFPIYIGSNITNLNPQDRVAWTDSLVTVHADLAVTETKFDLIGRIDTSILSTDEVLLGISDIVDKKTRSLLKHNTLPIRAFLTGGVDSMLVYSFLKKHTDNFSLVKNLHIDHDYFWLKNIGTIGSKFWAYQQIHHWTEPSLLTSGTPGDEYMLRSPVTADLWLKSQGVKVTDLLTHPQWANSMQSEYFRRSKNYNIFQEQTVNSSNLPWDLCNILANDWQHWHIGNTLTWTPLRDLEIFKLMLRLPLDAAITQVMNSQVSMDLIERNIPGLSQYVGTVKNSADVSAKLTELYQ